MCKVLLARMESVCKDLHMTRYPSAEGAEMKIELDLTPKQIGLLREGLDELPLNKYITLIVPMLEQLPITESDVANSLGNADSAPPAPLCSRDLGGGFSLTAYTPRGVSRMDALEGMLASFTAASRVAQALADIGNPNKPRKMYQPPNLSEHDAELQHQQEMARRLK